MWQEIERLIELSSQPLNDEIEPEKNPERRNYYRFLYHLVKWRQPRVALEIGVEGGLASAYMHKAAMEYGGCVVGIDLHAPPFWGTHYHFIEGDSTQLSTRSKVSSIVADYGKIGIVYQDSSHHYAASKKEWELYSLFLDKNAIWICDDITPSFFDPLVDPPGCGMVQYFEELPGDKRLYENVLHFGNVQGIVLTNE